MILCDMSDDGIDTLDRSATVVVIISTTHVYIGTIL